MIKKWLWTLDPEAKATNAAVCVSRDLIDTTSNTSGKECPRKERAQRNFLCAKEELRWQSSDDAHRWWHAVTIRVETG